MPLPDDPAFVKEIDESLDAFERDLAGLPAWVNMDAPEYLEMSLATLRKKSPDELSEAIFVLNQYSLNIQRLINKLRAWERWSVGNLDSLEAYYLDKVNPAYGWNGAAKQARHNPEKCKQINEFLRKTRMQLDRLYDLPGQIKLMTDAIRDLKFAAIRREKESVHE